MIEKQLKGMSPTKLRIILIATIIVLIAAAATGYWFLRQQLVSYAEEVNRAAVEANISSNDVRDLQKLQDQLTKDSVAITRTKNIVAESRSYQYQDQAINDLSRYAKVAGVTISGYGFDSAGSAATAAAPAAPVDPTAATAPTGLKTTRISVTLKTPVDYKALMRFIHSIELNLTKMQLTGISISQPSDAKSMVSVNPLTIEVYTR